MNTSATGGYLVPAAAVELDDALTDLFGDLVAGVTGLERDDLVRPRWQPNPPARPAKTANWCAVGVISQIPDDNVYLKQDNDVTQTLRRHEQLEVMASFYGPSARGYAGRFRDGVHIAQNRDVLRQAGIAVVEVGGAVNAAEPINNEWLPRVDVKAIFTRELGRTYQVLSFAAATGVIVTETLTVPFSVNEGE